MKWITAVSENPDTAAAIGEAAQQALAELGDHPADLVLVFATPHHAEHFADVPAEVAMHLPRALLLGCTGGGVLGHSTEVEHRPGVSLVIASLPGVDLRPFHLDDADIPLPENAVSLWRKRLGLDSVAEPGAAEPETHFILLPEPFSVRPERLLRSLDVAFPNGAKLGGMASGGGRPGAHALWLGPQMFRRGVVGVALRGALAVDTVVAQGCKPIGKPLLVTRSKGNVVLELDGRTPAQALRDMASELSEEDLALVQQSLLIGVEMTGDKVEYRQGDFLIRQIAEMDPEKGWMSIGARLQQWQVVQFHVRDGRTSAEDLRRMLQRYRTDQGQANPVGALMFSCMGRGEHLYGVPNHDTGVFGDVMPGVPLGGFFCNGEIGRIGQHTYLHGFTSSFGLFRDAEAELSEPHWQMRGSAEA